MCLRLKVPIIYSKLGFNLVGNTKREHLCMYLITCLHTLLRLLNKTLRQDSLTRYNWTYNSSFLTRPWNWQLLCKNVLQGNILPVTQTKIYMCVWPMPKLDQLKSPLFVRKMKLLTSLCLLPSYFFSLQNWNVPIAWSLAQPEGFSYAVFAWKLRNYGNMYVSTCQLAILVAMCEIKLNVCMHSESNYLEFSSNKHRQLNVPV